MAPYRRESLPSGRTDWARLEREPGDSAITAPDDENPVWTAAAFESAEYVQVNSGHGGVSAG